MLFHRSWSRLAALGLLFASPGLGGLAVDAAHPCPERAPWTVAANDPASDDGSSVPSSGHHHNASTGHHDCKCVGACQFVPAVRSVDADHLLAAQKAVQVKVPRPHHSAFIPVGRPADRLPPATAPPLAQA